MKRSRVQVASIDVQELTDAEMLAGGDEFEGKCRWDKSIIVRGLATKHGIDRNTARAIAVIFDFIHDINSWLDANKADTETIDLITKKLEQTAGSVLGLLPANLEELSAKSDINLDAVMQLLIEIRNNARKEKNFDLADEIRDKLAQQGIELKDTPQGTEWEER